MKKLIVLLLGCMMLVACTNNNKKSEVVEETWVKEDVIQLFKGNNKGILKDCVVVDDEAYDLVGVVLYDMGSEFTTVGFMDSDGECYGVGVNTQLIKNREMKYIGNGQVVFRLKDKNEQYVNDNRVVYSPNETDVHYKIDSEIHISSLQAKISEVRNDSYLVERIGSTQATKQSIKILKSDIEHDKLEKDMLVEIYYNGIIQETDPKQLGEIYSIKQVHE